MCVRDDICSFETPNTFPEPESILLPTVRCLQSAISELTSLSWGKSSLRKIILGDWREFGGKIFVVVVQITVLPFSARLLAKEYINDVFPPAPMIAMQASWGLISVAATKSPVLKHLTACCNEGTFFTWFCMITVWVKQTPGFQFYLGLGESPGFRVL